MVNFIIKFQSLGYLEPNLLDSHMENLNLNCSEFNSEPSLIYVASNQKFTDHLFNHMFAVGLEVERLSFTVYLVP